MLDMLMVTIDISDESHGCSATNSRYNAFGEQMVAERVKVLVS
jgi:hypothetical protein